MDYDDCSKACDETKAKTSGHPHLFEQALIEDGLKDRAIQRGASNNRLRYGQD